MSLPPCAVRLEQARTALHKLATGGKTVQVGYGDRQVRYSATEIDQLRTYVRELEAECGGCDGEPKVRRPFGVCW